MAGPEDAARNWLTRIADMYEGMDAGDTDPVHLARVEAQERLAAGPKTSDPFTVVGIMIEALPYDRRAVTLGDTWIGEYLEELRKL